MESPHTPVMPEQVLRYLDPSPGESYLDLTAGYGGHATKVLEASLGYKQTTLIDRDETAVQHLSSVFKGRGATIVHQDFLAASQDLESKGQQFDMILADLGTSSVHLNNQQRGFSFLSDVRLDMRMDQRQAKTAETVVNDYSEEELARILKQYGEEPKAKRIAKSIVRSRPIKSTSQLADLVKQSWPGRSKQHPATRTFQALRIEVNDEIRQLEQALPLWFKLLAPEGRIVVISFHSLEDRLVKQAMKMRAGDRYDAVLKLLSSKPIVPEPSEIVSNPRARSAKLRAAAKIKTYPHNKGG